MAKKNKKKKHKKTQTTSSFYDNFNTPEKPDSQQSESVIQETPPTPNYKYMTIPELCNELKAFNLVITEHTILKSYQKYHDIYILYLEIMRSYIASPQADTKLNTVSVFTLLEKIINKYFMIDTIPDAYYIQKDARSMAKVNSDHASYIILMATSISERLINYSFVTEQKSFKHFQETYHMNIAEIMVNAFDHLTLTKPSNASIYSTITLVKSLCISFASEKDFIEDMEALLLKWYGYINDEEKMEEQREVMLIKYPNEPYFIHYALLSGIQHTNNISAIEHYYLKARKYMIFSNAEKQLSQKLEKLITIENQKQCS